MGKRGRGCKTWLRQEGYSVRLAKLSPHEFDIPQIRQRIYIVGSSFFTEPFPMAQEGENGGLNPLSVGLAPWGSSPDSGESRPVPRCLAGVS